MTQQAGALNRAPATRQRTKMSKRRTVALSDLPLKYVEQVRQQTRRRSVATPAAHVVKLTTEQNCPQYWLYQMARSVRPDVAYDRHRPLVGWKYRPDVADVDLRIILECDGLQHHAHKKRMKHDHLRYRRLMLADWWCLRYTANEVAQAYKSFVAKQPCLVVDQFRCLVERRLDTGTPIIV